MLQQVPLETLLLQWESTFTAHFMDIKPSHTYMHSYVPCTLHLAADVHVKLEDLAQPHFLVRLQGLFYRQVLDRSLHDSSHIIHMLWKTDKTIMIYSTHQETPHSINILSELKDERGLKSIVLTLTAVWASFQVCRNVPRVQKTDRKHNSYKPHLACLFPNFSKCVQAFISAGWPGRLRVGKCDSYVTFTSSKPAIC